METNSAFGRYHLGKPPSFPPRSPCRERFRAVTKKVKNVARPRKYSPAHDEWLALFTELTMLPNVVLNGLTERLDVVFAAHSISGPFAADKANDKTFRSRLLAMGKEGVLRQPLASTMERKRLLESMLTTVGKLPQFGLAAKPDDLRKTNVSWLRYGRLDTLPLGHFPGLQWNVRFRPVAIGLPGEAKTFGLLCVAFELNSWVLLLDVSPCQDYPHRPPLTSDDVRALEDRLGPDDCLARFNGRLRRLVEGLDAPHRIWFPKHEARAWFGDYYGFLHDDLSNCAFAQFATAKEEKDGHRNQDEEARLIPPLEISCAVSDIDKVIDIQNDYNGRPLGDFDDMSSAAPALRLTNFLLLLAQESDPDNVVRDNLARLLWATNADPGWNTLFGTRRRR